MEWNQNLMTIPSLFLPLWKGGVMTKGIFMNHKYNIALCYLQYKYWELLQYFMIVLEKIRYVGLTRAFWNFINWKFLNFYLVTKNFSIRMEIIPRKHWGLINWPKHIECWDSTYVQIFVFFPLNQLYWIYSDNYSLGFWKRKVTISLKM